MSIWDWFRPKEEKISSRDLLNDLLRGRESRSGEPVTVKTALDVTTVFDCVRVIAEGVSQVPFRVFQEANGTRKPARNHSLFDVLHRKPNTWQTSFEYRETMMFHVLLTGNAYSFKNMVGSRREIRELIPIQPNKVEVVQLPDLTLNYIITAQDGTRRTFPQDMIWHIKGPSWNSWLGLEAVTLAREAIGLAISTEATQSDLHKNGVQTTGTYSVEGTLNNDQQKQLAKWVTENFNKSGPLILDRNAKWTSLQMSGVDAQHLETRKLQIEEVCRAFRVMPIMVGHSDNTGTYASAEQLFLAHVIHTLTPWYERIEQSVNANLLTDQDRKNGIFAKFTVQALLRGAAKDRAEVFSRALGSGGSPAWMTQNEIRALEEMDSIEGGDTLSSGTNSGDDSAEPNTTV